MGRCRDGSFSAAVSVDSGRLFGSRRWHRRWGFLLVFIVTNDDKNLYSCDIPCWSRACHKSAALTSDRRLPVSLLRLLFSEMPSGCERLHVTASPRITYCSDSSVSLGVGDVPVQAMQIARCPAMWLRLWFPYGDDRFACRSSSCGLGPSFVLQIAACLER